MSTIRLPILILENNEAVTIKRSYSTYRLNNWWILGIQSSNMWIMTWTNTQWRPLTEKIQSFAFRETMHMEDS
jgi:hypothetical protein